MKSANDECVRQSKLIEASLKETSILKANERLIVGNTVLFQTSVESPAMRYQCRHNRVCLSPIFAFKFPAHRHLGLHDVTSQLLHTKDALLPNNSGNHMTSQNPKWRYTGNLKAKIGDSLNSILLLLNVIFTLSNKI